MKKMFDKIIKLTDKVLDMVFLPFSADRCKTCVYYRQHSKTTNCAISCSYHKRAMFPWGKRKIPCLVEEVMKADHMRMMESIKMQESSRIITWDEIT